DPADRRRSGLPFRPLFHQQLSQLLRPLAQRLPGKILERKGGTGMQSPATPALNTAFHCENPRWQRRYEQALEGLAANVRLLPCYPRPVLQEGGMYQGIWLECGPHEGALYGEYDPQIARNNHEIFWDLAREDGFIPPFIRETPGDGQLQTVVPLAQTALECAQKLGQESLLARGYEACAR